MINKSKTKYRGNLTSTLIKLQSPLSFYFQSSKKSDVLLRLLQADLRRLVEFGEQRSCEDSFAGGKPANNDDETNTRPEKY